MDEVTFKQAGRYGWLSSTVLIRRKGSKLMPAGFPARQLPERLHRWGLTLDDIEPLVIQGAGKKWRLVDLPVFKHSQNNKCPRCTTPAPISGEGQQ